MIAVQTAYFVNDDQLPCTGKKSPGLKTRAFRI